MAYHCPQKILVIGRAFPVLPFERALQACQVFDYLCVDTVSAARMLIADGFAPDIVVVDETLFDWNHSSLGTTRRISWIIMPSDADDFAITFERRLQQAIALQKQRVQPTEKFHPAIVNSSSPSFRGMFLSEGSGAL